MKTTESSVAALENAVIELHPYDTPEFVCLPIVSGNHRYLDWITSSLADPIS